MFALHESIAGLRSRITGGYEPGTVDEYQYYQRLQV